MHGVVYNKQYTAPRQSPAGNLGAIPTPTATGIMRPRKQFPMNLSSTGQPASTHHQHCTLAVLGCSAAQQLNNSSQPAVRSCFAAAAHKKLPQEGRSCAAHVSCKHRAGTRAAPEPSTAVLQHRVPHNSKHVEGWYAMEAPAVLPSCCAVRALCGKQTGRRSPCLETAKSNCAMYLS
jgi:hypothetical protein